MDANNYIWAKAGDDDKQWIPLWLHLRDTFHISGWIWDNHIPKKHQDYFHNDLKISASDAKHVYQLLCGLHDLGKCTPDFSGRTSVVSNTIALYNRMKIAGFNFSSFMLNRGDSAIRHEVASEYLIKSLLLGQDIKLKTSKTVLSIISAHHGNPVSVTNDAVEQLNNLNKNDKDTLWTESAGKIFKFIMEGIPDSHNVLKTALENGLSWRSQMIFSGYLSMADWLASSEELFPLWEFKRIEEQSWNTDNFRLENAIKNVKFPKFFDADKIDITSSPENLFQQRFGFSTPRPSQRDLVEAVGLTPEPNDIFILEAPMGEGKTEAALIASEILMKRSGTTGVFFGMPTMATGEAIYGRIKPYLDSLLDSTEQNATLELMHSKAFLSEAKRVNDNQAVRNTNGSGLVSKGWLSGRYLKTLNAFVVGTVDNFLMMQLPLKYAYWRHLGFSQKVIIIDEVHAMDIVMKHYLKEALKVIGFYGCPVILCSATLKNEEREAYLAAYNKGKALGGEIV